MAAGDGPRGRGPARAPTRDAESARRPRRASRSPPTSRRASACGSSSSSPTAGRAGARCPALRDQVVAALAEARHTGWDGLARRRSARYLDDFWERADVEIEGDAELQQAVRFALFHVLQAGARAERRAIPAKGLTGPGYDGHTFWDTETLRPAGAHLHRARTRPRDALRWRHATLDLARERAAQLGLAGAAFPWRTIRGQECSGYWPAGTAAFHINARHRRRGRPLPGARPATRRSSARSASSCSSRRRGSGARSATTTPQGRFRIDGVTGPDEYSAIADNNVYTNLMAQRNLRAAADAVARHPGRAARRSAPTSRRRRPGATPRATWSSRATTRSACTRSRRASPSHQVWDFEAHAARAVPAAAALPLLRPLPQAGRQAGRPRAGDALSRRRLHRRGEGAQLRLLRGAHGPRLVALGVHPGGDRGRGRPPRARLRLLRRGRADGPRTTSSTTPATASTSPRWPAPGSPPSPASAACATTAASSASRRACPARARAARVPPRLPRHAGSGRGDAGRTPPTLLREGDAARARAPRQGRSPSRRTAPSRSRSRRRQPPGARPAGGRAPGAPRQDATTDAHERRAGSVIFRSGIGLVPDVRAPDATDDACMATIEKTTAHVADVMHPGLVRARSGRRSGPSRR